MKRMWWEALLLGVVPATILMIGMSLPANAAIVIMAIVGLVGLIAGIYRATRRGMLAVTLPGAHLAIVTGFLWLWATAGHSTGMEMAVPMFLDLPIVIIDVAVRSAFGALGQLTPAIVVWSSFCYGVLGTLQWYWIGQQITRWSTRKKIITS